MQELASPYRSLPIALREDLSIAQHTYRGRLFWIVKDPIGLEFYRFNEQEYALLSWLDGTASLDELKQRFDERFAPHRIKHKQLQSFVIDLHKKSLLTSMVSGQGRHLLKLGAKKRWKKRKQRVSNPLVIRWRGVNPDRFLGWLNPKVGWLFSKPAVSVGILFMLSALLWFGAHFQEAANRMPVMSEFFSHSNWLLIGVVMMVVKVLHELGHGILFKRFGGYCHEIGVMFLVFMPTLYCNTSDSWLLKNKWQRAAIGAAGLYVELILAALATFGWWFSQPGTFQNICLNTMILSSISAVLFNGNPLLKFDAYYILSDILEIPNLQQRSGTLVRNWFLTYGLGLPEDDEPGTTWQTKAWLCSYCIAASLYRIFLTFVICTLIVALFKPFGLAQAAKNLSFVLIGGMMVSPLKPLYKYFKVPGKLERMKRKNLKFTLGIAAAIGVLVFLVPLPNHVRCGFTIEPQGAKTVYVSHAATLHQIVAKPGEKVSQGDTIAVLRDIDVELQLASLRGEVGELEKELRFVELARHENSLNTSQVADLTGRLTTARQTMRELSAVQNQLVLRAPRDGYVIPEWDSRSQKKDEEESLGLDEWAGSTLHPENIGTTFDVGQPICQVGDFHRLEGKLAIDQKHIKRVAVGQDVRLQLDSKTSDILTGNVESISNKNVDRVASSLATKHGGSLGSKAAQADASNSVAKPLSSVFEARVSLPVQDAGIGVGLRGKAKVFVGYRTVAQRIRYALSNTFRVTM